MAYAHFQTPDELMKHVTEVLRDRYREPAGALATAAIQTTGEPILAAGRILISDEVLKARPVFEYERITLVEEWIPFRGLMGPLANLLGGGWTLADRTIPGMFRGANSRPQICGLHGPASWSEEVIDVSVQDAHASTLQQEAVVRAGMPAYPHVAAAAESWVFGRHLRKHRQAPDPGRFVLVLPDTRARIVRAELDATSVSLTIEAHVDRSDLTLQVSSPTAQVNRAEHSIPTDRRIRFDVPPETEEITLYLLDKPQDLLAQVELSRIDPLFGELPERLVSVRTAKADLLAGESDTTEYKPFCDLSSDKAAELLETVIAFANTRGGRLYVGVDRHGTPQGVPSLRQHSKATPRSGEPAAMLEDFRARLRALICDRIRPVPAHDIQDLTIDGCPVLVLDVPRGDKPPYATHEHDVFIRKGSTNRKPDPKTELPGIKATGLPF